MNSEEGGKNSEEFKQFIAYIYVFQFKWMIFEKKNTPKNVWRKWESCVVAYVYYVDFLHWKGQNLNISSLGQAAIQFGEWSDWIFSSIGQRSMLKTHTHMYIYILYINMFKWGVFRFKK